ncbi:hypothetical protein SISNIDRAFT_492496 [Sistotremastrum niveocremeum HHB9708]|uniref:TEA domain-containing protein n=1 Tax=Sistotremastrum niveocremeum HHB9708 TaxID=1314777 RepID=A0A165AMS0_9AGAM|nr:hypothetical protein SISNIDRAFT_492496 [Sistotremastrum niveocremeum HHB9708]
MQPRRHKKWLPDGSGEVWPDHAEVHFMQAIDEYEKITASGSASHGVEAPSRNMFIVLYLKKKGIERTKQQVASHVQQLKKKGYHDQNAPLQHTTTEQRYESKREGVLGPWRNNNNAVPTHPHRPTSSRSPRISPVSGISIHVDGMTPFNVRLPPPGLQSTQADALVNASCNGSYVVNIKLLVPAYNDICEHIITAKVGSAINLALDQEPWVFVSHKFFYQGSIIHGDNDPIFIQGNPIWCPLQVPTQLRGWPAAPGSSMLVEQSIIGKVGHIATVIYHLVQAPFLPPLDLTPAHTYNLSLSSPDIGLPTFDEFF